MLADKSAGGAGWGVKTAYLFCCTCGICGVIFFFTMPEVSVLQLAGLRPADSDTQFKNRTYAELDELFERRIPTRKFKSTMTAAQLEAEQLSA
jgi:SP family general alpha glucoside:H+ symporter-like MFS transporter